MSKGAVEIVSSDVAVARGSSDLQLFEELFLPHLDSAYNLAMWIARDEQNARDVVQESYLRAFRFFDTFRGGDGKAWLLEIVRNTSRTWLRRESRNAGAEPFDEKLHTAEHTSPEEVVSAQERMGVLRRCIEMLPIEFREVLVMRELEEMSYREIGEVTGLAQGTIMSRLSRARKRLEDCAAKRTAEVPR
jgi:RNA polymerase sigma-70 factor (ECF subfamily)